MAVSTAFCEYALELLSPLGPCVARRMFGGYGISLDGMTLAILANLGQGETLWLKVHEATRARFVAEGCQRFEVTMRGKPTGMDYYSAPADAMESPALMLPWARMALQAALEKRKPPAAKKRLRRGS